MSLISILSIIFMFMFIFLSQNTQKSSNKQTPFECGIESFSSFMSFSYRFFNITLIFLLFDIELIILLPLPLMSQMSPNFSNLVITVFSLSLIITLLYEFKSKSLSWTSWESFK